MTNTISEKLVKKLAKLEENRQKQLQKQKEERARKDGFKRLLTAEKVGEQQSKMKSNKKKSGVMFAD